MDLVLKFKLTQTEEWITGRAGLAFVYEFCQKLDLTEKIDTTLPLPGSEKGYLPSCFVLPVILMLIGGGQALAHITQLKSDKALEKLLDLEKMPDPGTLGDWLARVYPKGYEGLNQINQWLIHKVLSGDTRQDYTFDPDATGIESHKCAAKITYKGYRGYMPMLGTLAEIPLWLVDDFREGNVPPQADALFILENALKRMPAGKRIARLRSDSAWYQAEIINRCEAEKIIFSITADQDCAVKEAISRIEHWEPVVDKNGFQTEREQGEIVHTMGKTKKAFRLVVQRWLNPQRHKLGQAQYCYHVIASNSEQSALEVIHWHNARANSENANKELKIGFGMERLPCGDFGANAMYFRIGVLAYNLTVALKYILMPPSERTKTIATMRWLWVQTPAKLVRHGRQWILKLSAFSDPLFQWWQELRRRRQCCLW